MNATGPWIDRVRALEDPRRRRSAASSKGVHLLLDLDRPWSAALTIPHDPVRVTFAYPWQGMLLLGTTDTLYEGDPSEVGVEPADVARVLDEASVGVEREVLDPGRVRASFAGLRVLPGLSGETLTARRETQYVFGPRRHADRRGREADDLPPDRARRARAAARRARLDAVRPAAGAAAGRRRARGCGRRIARRFPELDPATRSHLLHLYGSLAEDVLAPALHEPLAPRADPPGTHPTCSRRSATQASEEWAVSVEDVVWRRTTLGYRGLADAAAARVAEALGCTEEAVSS